MIREFQKLNWLQVKKLVPDSVDTIIIPVGTIEAHGSACIGTDNFIPETIALGIAERINGLVAPTINYGITRSLYRYSGGLTISPDVFEAYLTNVLDSLADNGFHNFIVMNGHGGNNSALKAAAVPFHRERKANIAVIHWWELCAEMTQQFFGHAGGHAGTDEAAMVQAIDPALVDEAAYDKEMAYLFRPGADVYPVPGTVLLYKKDEGYPEFDAARSGEYRQKVIATVGDFVEMVLSRWQKSGL